METVVELKNLPAKALRDCLKEGYTVAQLRKDLVAGLLVGIIAIPLAMALAIAVGVPPQLGLYTAVVGGFFSALLGGSRIQVVGPTAAFVVILVPIQQHYGLPGLLTAGFMSGLILMAMGAMRLGRMIEFIPFPVTTGFTAGIGVVIAVLQLKDFFGLTVYGAPEHLWERLGLLWDARGSVSPADLCVGVLTLILLLLPRLPKRSLTVLPRWLRKIPMPVLALPLAAGLALLLPAVLGPGWQADTIGSRFHWSLGGVTMAGIPRLPPVPGLPWTPQVVSYTWLLALLPSALAIAMLGAIESLLSAVVADGMARTRHDPDAELLAVGTANVLTPFFGGIPATGAIARTAANFRFGGRTPVAAMAHSVTILLGILLLAPLFSYLPMAALASLLLLVAWNMSEAEQFLRTMRTAPGHDVVVLWICFLLTVMSDMVVAVSVGVVLSSLLFMGRMASETEGRLATEDDPGLPGPPPKGVLVYDIIGPLFFGAAERAMRSLRNISSEAGAVVFRFDRVSSVDATGVVALEGVLEEMHRHGIKVVFTGMRHEVETLVRRSGLEPVAGQLAFCHSVEKAYALLLGRPVTARKRLGPLRFHVLHRQKGGVKQPRRQTG